MKYRSITKLKIQYAHRFLGYEGEAQYLHGHSGLLTIEVEGNVHERTGFVYPCNSIKRIAWDYLQNFDHALILQQEDPLLPGVISAYEQQGIKNGVPSNRNIGIATPCAAWRSFLTSGWCGSFPKRCGILGRRWSSRLDWAATNGWVSLPPVLPSVPIPSVCQP